MAEFGSVIPCPFFRLLRILIDMSTEYDDVLTNQPVVIDNVRRLVVLCETSAGSLTRHVLQGSGTIKAGFAGQDHPKCFFPSL